MNFFEKILGRPRNDSVEVRSIGAAETVELLKGGKAVLVDVREPAEWNEGVAEPAHLRALSDLTGARGTWAPFLMKYHAHELILYCQAGKRAETAAKLLASEGFRVANLGGIGTWRDANLPMRTP